MVGVRGWLEARRKVTAKSGPGHLPTAWVAILLLEVIILLLGPVLWAVGGWDLIGDKTRLALDAFDAISEPDKKVEAYGKLVSTIGLLAATPIGMIGVGLAFWRTWNQHRDGTTAIRKLDAEAFAKAVEQLGHDKSSIRMGAVLALEALGKSTSLLLSQTIEILCAYVREMRPTPPLPETDKEGNKVPDKISFTEIQMIIDKVEILKKSDSNNRINIDLSQTNISGVVLMNRKLQGFQLNKADLHGAELSGSDLSEADASGTNLSGAVLFGANLSKADLSDANLSEADLSDANLRDANLRGADLSGADLSRADLSGADLREAKLSGAGLRGAKLSGAVDWANLNQINLTSTIFKDTILPDGRVWPGPAPPPGFPPPP